MTETFVAHLPDRGVVSLQGPDADKLLQSLITNDMAALAANTAIFAGLLTPQGKILADFFVLRSQDGVLIDVARDRAADLVKRLSMYKLRAAVDIRDLSAERQVLACWGERPYSFDSMPETAVVEDPRLAALGLRIVTSATFGSSVMQATTGKPVTDAAYHAHRIATGVPEGGRDYAFGDTFPHEALFDQLHGVSFSKGCYVGQEIVARMEHRGTARKRIVTVTGTSPLPPAGTDIMAGDIAIGTLGQSDGRRGLALLRLDRAAEFKAKGVALTAAGIPLDYDRPSWATFALNPTPHP